MDGTDSLIHDRLGLSWAFTFQNNTLLAAKADFTNFVFGNDNKIHLIW